MIVEGQFLIKGRGWVVTGTLAEPPPWPDVGEIGESGLRLTRASDGKVWTVRGIERHPRLRNPRVGEPIGCLVEGDDPPTIDDVVTLSRI